VDNVVVIDGGYDFIGVKFQILTIVAFNVAICEMIGIYVEDEGQELGWGGLHYAGGLG
tara:strand:- start:166 stop:339 length:174 start_codon:yes stop_codon:yes gene_type:complete